jgi:hypothetical protein
MRIIRPLLSALLIAAALAALAGCGAPPMALADIPAPPEAAPLARGENALADTLASSLEGALGQRGTLELKLYSVPASLSWQQVDGFYAEKLAGSDWRPADELRNESAAISTAGWTRGGLASEQGLAVGYAPDALGGGAFMIVALFSE